MHSPRDDGPCSHCGFAGRLPLPDWAEPGACFGLDGSVYRIIAIGSTNARTSGYHFENYARVERVTEQWALPSEGCSVGELGGALKTLFESRSLFVEDFARALRRV